MHSRSPSRVPAPGRIADRYELHESLGRGGMATVYRATDLVSGRQVALKQLHLTGPEHASVGALFEREFHTLAQLHHPSVITVYDYGLVSGAGPYYTMELLDGGDLRHRAPVPWREACALMFDVCSSLALLHSRRLLHRDISPRNVRCTRDGRAKLIDFGAMGPMLLGGGTIVGTPAFAPPETVQRSALDGRADLFSLGATFYYALTGSLAFSARSFADVYAAWRATPARPSARVPDVPAALDELVLSLLRIEPAYRPGSAFEVMQRLAALAGLEGRESAAVSAAYLTEPTLIGREELLSEARAKLERAVDGRGGGIILRGEPGVGRSRMLDACALEAKTLGATVLRVSAGGHQQAELSTALSLAQHLLDALPSHEIVAHHDELFEPLPEDTTAAPTDRPLRCALRSPSELKQAPDALQRALCRCLLEVSREQPLLIAVDDLEQIDLPSAAVLAELVDRARRAPLLLAMTVDTQTERALALDVLESRCESWTLRPLTAPQTQALFESLFGEVDHVVSVAEAIYEIARGNPRQTVELAQHLLDRKLVHYAEGTWTLPGTLAASDLPRSAEDALTTKLETLEPHARWLAEAHALAFYDVFKDADYAALRPDVGAGTTALAVAQLLEHQVLSSEGGELRLSNRVWPAVLRAGISRERAQECHRALAALYADDLLARPYHEFEAGLEDRGVASLLTLLSKFAEQSDLVASLDLRVVKLAPSLDRAIELVEGSGRPRRELCDLRRWSVALSVASGDVRRYWQAAPAWLEQLKHDSGFTLWEEDSGTADAGARLTRALQGAFERFAGPGGGACAYPVDQAIKLLAEWVVYSIATGARSYDNDLLATLPRLLEPFAVLSPLLDALWQNAVGTLECARDCHHERARERWIDVHRRLSELDSAQIPHLAQIRGAIATAIGMIEATFGLPSAARWVDLMDVDRVQKISALCLRQVVRLEQGDSEGAARLRREAEILALQQGVPQLFTQSIAVELSAYANACDLAGVKRCVERQAAQAARNANWLPYATEGRARFDLLRGDVSSAKLGFERVLAMVALDARRRSPSRTLWVLAKTGLAQCLLAQAREREARALAVEALAICDELGVHAITYELVRTLAKAEAKLGDSAAAIERLERLIATQTSLGAAGLRLGMTYEARALIAIWSGDREGYAHYARLTAHEYRYGARSPLSARYERLKLEASRHDLAAPAELTDFEPSSELETIGHSNLTDLQSAVAQAMTGTQRIEDRSLRALRMVCDARAARAGHLYLARKDGSLWCAASLGRTAPEAALREVIEDYLKRAPATPLLPAGSPSQAPRDPGSTTSVSGVIYELLIMSSVIEGQSQVAGVIALEPGEQPVLNPMQPELLATIAGHLLEVEVVLSAKTLVARGARRRKPT